MESPGRAELRRVTAMGSMILNFLTIKWNLIVSAVCVVVEFVCVRALVLATQRRVQNSNSAPPMWVYGPGRTF